VQTGDNVRMWTIFPFLTYVVKC